MATDQAKDVAHWMVEREAIRHAKEKGLPRPWTRDKVLATYRFCNVRREDDAVTRWIAKNWRNPNVDDPGLVRAMVLARLVNWPPTLRAIGYYKACDDKHVYETILRCEKLGKAWSGAYIVSTNGRAIQKALYVSRDIAGQVPIPCPLPTGPNALQASHTRLMGYNGLGSFMAAQIIADLKNTPGHPLKQADDWWTWAAPGPGSKRGLGRYFQGRGRPVDFLKSLNIVRQEVEELLPPTLQRLCMQDWQNVMCEMDKWWRATYGQGRPKAYYTPNPPFSSSIS